MATSARLRHSHISPQKARLVADQIRGLPVDKAIDLLTFSNKKSAAIIKKLLLSAIANAEHNDGADIDELKVKSIYIDVGPTMKRLRPRALGRADRILKRTRNLTEKVDET